MENIAREGVQNSVLSRCFSSSRSVNDAYFVHLLYMILQQIYSENGILYFIIIACVFQKILQKPFGLFFLDTLIVFSPYCLPAAVSVRVAPHFYVSHPQSISLL